MIRVDLNVNNAADLLDTAAYGAGAKVRLERATSEAGVYSEVTTLALVAGTDSYTYWDGTGTPASWYRSRVSDTGGVSFSAYSDPFRSTAIVAYAEVDDLEEMLPTVAGRDRNWLYDRLVDATNYINAECGRDFFRHPQVDGTETRVVRTYRGDRIIVNAGIVSLSAVAYAPTFGDPFTPLGAEFTDWYLDDPMEARSADGTELTTYYSLRLPESGSITNWYTTPRGAQLTGVFGWQEVPGIIRAGTLSLARQFVSQRLTVGGSPGGDVEFGSGFNVVPLPTETYRAIAWGRRMHYSNV